MNNIFFIHSNILTICCYQTVKECIDRKETVKIITNRGCSWPFFEGEVTVYDFAQIFKGEDKNRVAFRGLKALKDFRSYRRYLVHLHRVVREIVAKEDFCFYLPSMAMDMTAAFAHNKYCKSYYYVDEGYLAYSPAETLQRYVPNRYKNLVKSLFGIEDHYHYEVSPKFKGSISITKDAFAWNDKKERRVNAVVDYIGEVKQSIPAFDDVIITEYLRQEYDVLIKCIDYTVERILQCYPNSKIGIKIHPHAIVYNREQTIRIQNYLTEKYAGVLSFIPVNVSIEVMSLVYHPRLYSLLELSSIILYAVLFKSSKTNLIEYKEGSVTIQGIASIEEFREKTRK